MRPLVWFASQIHLSLGVDWYTKPLTSVRGLSLYLCVRRYVRPLKAVSVRLCNAAGCVRAGTSPRERRKRTQRNAPAHRSSLMWCRWTNLVVYWPCIMASALPVCWCWSCSGGYVTGPERAKYHRYVCTRKPESGSQKTKFIYWMYCILANKCRKKNDAVM